MVVFNRQISSKLNLEIIFVDDGSTDLTSQVIHRFLSNENINFSIIKNRKNRGKGYSVKRGVLNSKGDMILFMDADNATRVFEIYNFLPFLNKGYSVIIGTRGVKSSYVERKNKLRIILSKIYIYLTNVILGLKFTDITCGFKLFEREVALKIFKKAKINKWSFDAEILFLAKIYNYRVKEVPIRWREIKGSRVSLKKDILNSLIELFYIRWLSLRGKYQS